MVFAVRGAIQVTRNATEEIHDAAARLVKEICARNGIGTEDIVSIVFSVTEDLSKGNPATGARHGGFADIPLFSTQEPRVEGAMPRIIRVLLTAQDASAGIFSQRRKAAPVYLDGAEALRPDLRS